MKRGIVVLAALLSAASAHASWYPKFDTNWVTMQVGEKRTVTVQAQWSGITDYGFSGWVFGSTNPEVATVQGSLMELGGVGIVEITAVAPGTATLKWSSDVQSEWGPRFIEIEVGADVTPPRIDQSALATTVGKPVTLSVNYPGAYCWCVWYAGRAGDTSRELGGGRDLIVTPSQIGKQYYWVQVITPFVMSSAETSIEVKGGRQRSVRH